MQGFVSTADLAEEVKVTPETVVRWIGEGHLEGAFRRRGRWWIPVEEAQSFAEDYEPPDWMGGDSEPDQDQAEIDEA